MKKLIYSKVTKFLVWLLVLALTVPMVDCFYSGLMEYTELGGDSIYAFSRDFESSYYLSELLSMPVNAVAFSYMDVRNAPLEYTVHGDGSITGRYREYSEAAIPVAPSHSAPAGTPSPEVTPTPAPTLPPAAASPQQSSRNEELYAVLEERISSFADDERIEYYIKVNDRVYTNTDATPEELMERDFSYLNHRSPDGSGERLWNGVKSHLSSFDNTLAMSFESFGADEITVCTAVVDSHIDAMRETWLQQEQIVKSSFEKILVLLCVFLVLCAYLLMTAGKSAAGPDERGLMDRLWTEVYLLTAGFGAAGGLFLAAALFYELFEASYGSYYGGIPEYMALPLVYIIVVLTVLVVLGSLVMCARKLRQGSFLKDSVAFRLLALAWRIGKALLMWLWRLAKTVWKLFTGTWRALASEIRSIMARKTGRWLVGGLSVFSLLLWLCGILTPSSPVFLLFASLLFAAAVYGLIKRGKDMDSIRTGTKEIRAGKLSYEIAPPHSEDLKELASDINRIAQGLDQSVAAKLKAEKMKTELITNVSHDLKTPLTSIISYTELLSKVEGLPEEAADYISIIASKSDRLKTLTQDLFDISKVQSGSEEIQFEKLDAAVLIEQSLAEREAEISASGLNFIVSAEKELYFMGDGRKLSRAVGNLVDNILRYSMKGTRVFITAARRDDRLIVEFKNIASYLMEFEPEEIVGRFVRGDSSRTDGGTGLGLAIVKSYVEACRGSFSVTVDGDLFKAVMSFGLI